ncbi:MULTISPECIES: glycine betaine/L-proline ABC transporter permease ProW [Aeromonas]|jgi:glycine betaine/proline transport system permease protein|uniref:ABC-type transport system permease protein (Probable substrate glycine betaine) n=1 Tax=Aeromonas salmonicida subsp. pectinolytica 34mel TaxID=1324960 RepID=T0R3Q9_AERSA|nr:MULTISPECIES: glycine betaine/L-proline ABC transporter permease ProW [Aeromonas]MBP6452010.1 glycine betaine/L-proline ABC transporter permease ProW [Aeromonas sp.]ATP10830.1 ABC-type transport system permease protein (probable substrate glycine betaine) [Aeromonas salmonicida subsp. pectinolytica 34mel]EQC05968.1 glycine betaine/L-proline transport system permease protein [Aeromonas salmonicida subsp. pectinolytica 34mel]KTA78089.1 glycine/betaine ABC transporter permease [Aeromonas salmon
MNIKPFHRLLTGLLALLLLASAPVRADEAQADPWGASASTTVATDPWGSTETEAADWQNQIEATDTSAAVDWLDPFQQALVPLDVWVESGIGWLVENLRPVFQLIRAPVEVTLNAMTHLLQTVPSTLMMGMLALIAWQMVNGRMALGTLLSLVGIGLIGAWSDAMVTLSLVLTSLFFCILIGLPVGIMLARSERLSTWTRPLLDAMQTTPAFVYLIPIVMLFGIGNVPGVVVTVIFALPPMIRLTMLGIRQVPEDLVEAAHSFGASPSQLLFKVQLPLAMPTIMAGVNQTLMLALSMVVIASMIAVGGLGQMVLRGIGRLDMGLASIGGLGIVLLAIVLDRLTQAMGQRDRSRTGRWYQHGPVALLMRLRGRSKSIDYKGVNA